MNDDKNIFRFQLRFRTSEYADLADDLEQYDQADRIGRVRYLIRLGLALDMAGLTLKDIGSIASGSVEKPLPAPKRNGAARPAAQESAKPEAQTQVEMMLSRGFDITQFPGVKPA